MLPVLALRELDLTEMEAKRRHEEMLPALLFPTQPKNQKRGNPPCPNELRFKRGETVNTSKKRVRGGSSKFSKKPISIIPLDSKKDLAFWQQVSSDQRTDNSWSTVLRELYATRTPTKPLPAGRNDQAFVRVVDNDAKPQYYLKQLEEPAVVVHIQNDGEFWELADDLEGKLPTVNELVYSKGFIWTSPMPNWAWKNNGEKLIRCRIHLSEGTQVVMDRSPVYPTLCKLDENDESISIFPDVLLPAGEFKVISVTKYRSTKEVYESDDEVDEDPSSFVKLTPIKKGIPSNDVEYAQHRLYDVNTFIDIELEIVRSVILPQTSEMHI
jgi:hypothetical protein